MSSKRLQNPLLLVASYIFYAYWDWRFLGLILISTLLDFSIGRRLGALDDKTRLDSEIKIDAWSRKKLVCLSVICNLGILGFFKYFNFFTSSTLKLLAQMDIQVDPIWVDLILPIGISFYTFQTMSYTIDVYRGVLPFLLVFLAALVLITYIPAISMMSAELFMLD